MKHTINAKLLCLFAIIPLTGCMEQDKRQQLEKVAKDWCTTIRASQVIPVYPLTEDIQPGDVFLVRTPIQKQADEYKDKGFLPLDQRITRFHDLDYKNFYQNSFGTANHENTPHHWQFPPDGIPVSISKSNTGSTATEKEHPKAASKTSGTEITSTPDETATEPNSTSDANIPEPNGPGSRVATEDVNTAKTTSDASKGNAVSTHLWVTDWPNAPRAMFPSYSFNVQSGQGLTGALPLQGIPVGLSLMNADKATATVSIKDAYTYGVPLESIHTKIRNWAQKLQIKRMLESYRKAAVESEKPKDRLRRTRAGKAEPTVYLRVINRVYLTGSLNVSMSTAKSWGLGAMFGEAPNAKIPTLDNKSSLDKSVIEDYKSTLKALNETLDANDSGGGLGKAITGTGYGGRLKLVWAGGRSVTLSETFDRPLVIGYLGFDFPVMEKGELGLPVATKDQLTGIWPKEFPFTPIAPGELKTMSIALISSMKGILDEIANNNATAPEVSQEAKAHLDKLNSLVSYLPEKYSFDLYSDAPGDCNFTGPKIRKNTPVDRNEFDDFIVYYANVNRAIITYENMLGSDKLLIDGKPVSDGFRKQLVENRKAASKAWEDMEKIEQDPDWISAKEFCSLVLFGR